MSLANMLQYKHRNGELIKEGVARLRSLSAIVARQQATALGNILPVLNCRYILNA